MPMLILASLLFCLSGCSTSRNGADFSVAEKRLDEAILVANPEAKQHLIVAKEQFKAAEAACVASLGQLEEAVKEKNDAVKEAAYWKAKQRKALKELWFWRGALIVVGLFALRGPIFWIIRKFVGIPW